jgi:hypothetical protein
MAKVEKELSGSLAHQRAYVREVLDKYDSDAGRASLPPEYISAFEATTQDERDQRIEELSWRLAIAYTIVKTIVDWEHLSEHGKLLRM